MGATFRVVALLAVALALVTSGCGDDAGEASATIDVEATEFAFEPDGWTVPSAEEITLRLDNQGTIEHEWVLLTSGTEISSSEEFMEDMVVFEAEAGPGEVSEATFTAPAVGTYQVVCAIPGHLDSGMEGSLEVVD